jgi:acyl-CoA reductase-like NAD-dependent aldehyde dehydrogenase
LRHPILMQGYNLEDVDNGIDEIMIRQPVGVTAAMTPFLPYTMACGNTFILKPAERVPLTASRLVELLDEKGLPKGVVNLVVGGKPAVDALLRHPDVKAISFAAKPFTDSISTLAGNLNVGNGFDQGVQIGPVISPACNRIEGLIGKGIQHGANAVLGGRNAVVDGGKNGCYLKPTTLRDFDPGDELMSTGVFGPVLTLQSASALDQAIAILSKSAYGNAALISWSGATPPASSATKCPREYWGERRRGRPHCLLPLQRVKRQRPGRVARAGTRGRGVLRRQEGCDRTLAENGLTNSDAS